MVINHNGYTEVFNYERDSLYAPVLEFLSVPIEANNFCCGSRCSTSDKWCITNGKEETMLMAAGILLCTKFMPVVVHLNKEDTKGVSIIATEAFSC